MKEPQIITWPELWQLRGRKAFGEGMNKCIEYLKDEALFDKPSHCNPYKEETMDWYAWNRGWNFVLF